jgi:asparagine synthetase B (glutamine-hydrolysing)
MVLHSGGEMLGHSVFGMPNLAPSIAWPSGASLSSESSLAKNELDELVRLLQESACRSLKPHQDKRVGFTLSGGVDSSLLLYLIKRVYPNVDVVAYHTDWGFAPRSELQFARIAADFAGVELRVVDVSPKAQIPYIEEALSGARTISYSTVPVHMAFRMMVRDGVGIAVNALGLDELFTGYTVHKRFYSRSVFRFVPAIPRLIAWKPYRYASLTWGVDKAFFMAHNLPDYAFRQVIGSKIDFSRIYHEVQGKDLWTTIHNWILWAMISNFANATSRCAKANGLEVLYPYMDHELMKRSLLYSPRAKLNKAPIRHIMRHVFRFPESIASRGERWDKIGWGGTAAPYFASKEYMESITPTRDASRDWFTARALSEYRSLKTRPTVRALHMALFLKTLELV